MKLLPGKGAHLVLNEEINGFVLTALSDIRVCYTDEIHDADPRLAIARLLSGSAENELELTWVEENDDFGRKAIASMAYKSGELRVTVVLTKRNELKLDIREWYDRDASARERA